MKPYPNYKPSGIEWIGNIPEQWKVLTLRRVIKVLTDFTANGSFASLAENVNYLNEKSFARIVRLTDLRVNFENEGIYIDEKGYNFLRTVHLFGGEILVANVGAYAGIVCQMPILNINTALGPNMFLIKFKGELLNSEYAFYLLTSELFQKPTQLAAISSAQPKLNKDDIKERVILLPSIEEQKKISLFLTRKTKLLDDIILKKQNLIELLQEEKTAVINEAVTKGLDPDVKMKDSGIPWLGEIPKNWKLIKLKYLGGIKYGLGAPPKQKPDGLPLIRATNVKRGEISELDMIYVDPEEIPYDRDPVLKENDIIVVRSGAYTGDSAIIPKQYEGSITGYDMVVRIDNAVPKFIAYSFLSNYLLVNQLGLLMLRAAQPHLNREDLGETLVVLPPRIEQEEIVKFIEKKSSSIHNSIEKIQLEINLLQEYRTALINEAVTGKIDLRDINFSE